MAEKHRKKLSFYKAFFLIIGIVILFSFSSFAHAQDSKSEKAEKAPKKDLVIIKHKFKSLCDTGREETARCNTKVVTLDDGVTPLTGGVPLSSSLGPAQFHSAYQLPCQPNGPVSSSCSTPASFGPGTIAIVIAYHSPNIENDLNVFSSYFGIPSCTKANGCLNVVNEFGGNSLPLTVNPGWTLEASLDVETAHSICQTCKILLIEASSNSYLDLGTAVNAAANLGATSISNSYGGSEGSFQKSYDSYFTHPGIAVTASAGDSGFGAEFPASSPGVVAVGGTTLQLFTDFTYDSESVWSGTGSGCSKYELANPWQKSLSDWLQTGCGNSRAVADISADADPNTGAAVYDSTTYSGQSGWWQVGGTSLSSPIIAAAFAMGGSIPSQATSLLYANFNSTNFHDVSSGSNGFCGSIICTGALSYDGPSGLGTPNGLGGFGGPTVSASPTPTLTITPTLTPTPTITPLPSISPSPTISLTPSPTPVDPPPTVSISSPADGSTVRRGTIFTITAAATDNIKVTKVEFYIDGVLRSVDSVSPYRSSWLVPSKRNTTYSISAVAYDSSNNSSTSTVTVKTN